MSPFLPARFASTRHVMKDNIEVPIHRGSHAILRDAALAVCAASPLSNPARRSYLFRPQNLPAGAPCRPSYANILLYMQSLPGDSAEDSIPIA